MTAVGFTWCVSGLAWTATPSVFIVGYAFNPLPFALLFHMLCAFPTGRLDGPPQQVRRGALGYFVTTVLWWVILLFYDTDQGRLREQPADRVRRRRRRPTP